MVSVMSALYIAARLTQTQRSALPRDFISVTALEWWGQLELHTGRRR